MDIAGKAHPGVVFHLASKFLASHTPPDIEPLVRDNILFGAQILEAMARQGIRRIVHAGTSWQHYEDGEYRPVCLYAATKQAFEDLLAYYVEIGAMEAVTLKLFDTYGPDDPRKKLFSIFRDATSAKVPVAMSPGEQLIDLVHVDDVVDAFLRTAARLLDGRVAGHETYVVSSGKPIPLKEIARIFEKATGKSLRIDWGGKPYRPREVMKPWSGGIPLPGWRPAVELEEGIRRMEATRNG